MGNTVCHAILLSKTELYPTSTGQPDDLADTVSLSQTAEALLATPRINLSRHLVGGTPTRAFMHGKLC